MKSFLLSVLLFLLNTGLSSSMNYDQLEADGTTEAVRTWISTVLAGEEDANPEGGNQLQLHAWLKSGVVLCKLINELLESEGRAPVRYERGRAPFFTLMNVRNFNEGCVRYGMRPNLVEFVDVWEGTKAPFSNVIEALRDLGNWANSKGYQIPY